MNLEINLILLIKQFLYMIRKSKQKLKYLKTKKAFKGKQKAFVITFKGISVAKNRLRSESPPLRNKMLKLKESFRSTDNGEMVCLMFFFSLWNKISKDLNVIIINVSITVSWFYTFSFDFLSKSRE